MSAEPTLLLPDEPNREAVIRHLRRLGEERGGLFPFGLDGPQAWCEQGIYTLSWGSPVDVLMEFDFIGTDRHGETTAELAIYWSDPLDPLAMLRTRLNLLSMTATDRLAGSLSKRTDALAVRWQHMLDQAVRWTMQQYRTGDPGLLLRDADELPAGADVLTDPPLLEADGQTLVFGDGGTLKSWLALALAASLQAGESYIGGIEVATARRVGFLDWEWSARRHKRRLRQLTGPDMPDVAYLRCSRSIFEERDRIRRWARAYRIDYAIVDSVGLACGAEPESAEVANRFANALSELVPAALGVAHVTKAAAEKAPDKPFGSVYWHNGARRTWYVRAVGEPGSGGMTVGLYNRKANDGPLALPFAVDFQWMGERVTIQHRDVRDVPELDAARSIGARIRDLLGRQGAMPLHAVADELAEGIEAVRKAAQRGKQAGTLVSLPGPDGIYRWALKQREEG